MLAQSQYVSERSPWEIAPYIDLLVQLSQYVFISTYISYRGKYCTISNNTTQNDVFLYLIFASQQQKNTQRWHVQIFMGKNNTFSVVGKTKHF
jgi:hypothetical protein